MYCKQCASPQNTPNNSDNEIENSMAELVTPPKEQSTSENNEVPPDLGVADADKGKTVKEVEPLEFVKNSQIISTLTWLQFVQFFKEKKRNIFLVILSVLIIAIVLFMGLFNFSLYQRCPDGFLLLCKMINRSLAVYCSDRIPTWNSVYLERNAYHSNGMVYFLPYNIMKAQIHLHIAVDERGMDKRIDSLKFTELARLDGTEAIHRDDYLITEDTDDLYSFMINKIVIV